MIDVRRTGTASAAVLCGLAQAVLLTHLVAPGWTRRCGLDVWNLPDAIAMDRDARRDAEELGAQGTRLFREIELSDHVAAQLFEGTVSLGEAVAELEPVLLKRIGFQETAPHYFHTPSMRQAIARFLMARIPRIVVDDECEQQRVLYRLEEEYERMH